MSEDELIRLTVHIIGAWADETSDANDDNLAERTNRLHEEATSFITALQAALNK